MAAMVTMGFIFMILARESLARNRDEDDFLARVRDPKRCAGSRITPLPRLVRLISKAPQRLLRAVGKMQSLIARAVNDLRRAGRYKFVGRSRACRHYRGNGRTFLGCRCSFFPANLRKQKQNCRGRETEAERNFVGRSYETPTPFGHEPGVRRGGHPTILEHGFFYSLKKNRRRTRGAQFSQVILELGEIVHCGCKLFLRLAKA